MNARRVYSSPTDRSTGILCDQRIALNGQYVAQDYPEHLRRVKFKDPDSGKTVVFQMDQAAFAHQALFCNQPKCSEDSNLVRCGNLRAHRHRQKGAARYGFALHLSTDFVGVGF